MHWLDVLLPYIIGAATTLIVQLVIQLNVVPRVEARKRREDRWERNVLELAQLLATDVVGSASSAKVAQLVCHDLRKVAAEPGADKDKINRRLPEMVSEARHATNAFGDLGHVRIGLLTRQIERLSPASEELGRFSAAARKYWVEVASATLWHEQEDPSEAELEERWERECKARNELAAQVRVLAELPHPPHATLGRRLFFWKKKSGGG